MSTTALSVAFICLGISSTQAESAIRAFRSNINIPTRFAIVTGLNGSMPFSVRPK